MLVIILIIPTLLLVMWLILLCTVTNDDRIIAAYLKVLDNYTSIEKMEMYEKQRLEKLAMYKGIVLTGVRILLKIQKLYIGNTDKKIQKLKKENTTLQRGDLRSISMFVMPGYVIQREYEAIEKSQIYLVILKRCIELYGKKYSIKKAKQLIAKGLSYTIVGVSGAMITGVVIIALGNKMLGIMCLCVGLALNLVLCYAMYDELNDRLNKRRALISRQFPGVVSKLALLVTSGIIMDKAWKLTAHSSEAGLYREMRQTSEEIDNLISPEAAYGNFINRCNTKETAKLAGSIMQNLSKGNAEIGRLLKDMAREAWQERRFKAKRDAQKANSMLMIPTMMLFIAILIMLMVPIALSFSGL